MTLRLKVQVGQAIQWADLMPEQTTEQFWAEGFWSSSFWAPGFWAEDAPSTGGGKGKGYARFIPLDKRGRDDELLIMLAYSAFEIL